MSSPIPNGALDTQAQALLQRVTDDRERRCAILRSAAESQAKQIVHSARAEARNTVRNAVTQERARTDLGMRQATARAEEPRYKCLCLSRTRLLWRSRQRLRSSRCPAEC